MMSRTRSKSSMAEFRMMEVVKVEPEGVITHQVYLDDDHFADFVRTHPVITHHILDNNLSRRPHSLTLEKAKEKVKALVAELFDSWLQLRHIVNQHGTTVQNRWFNKTEEPIVACLAPDVRLASSRYCRTCQPSSV